MKKVYIIIIILAVGAAVLLWANSKKQNTNSAVENKKYEVTVPDNFPKDFPIDVTAVPASAKAPTDGSLVFKTNLLPAQAYAAYMDYLTQNKWQIMLKDQHALISSINAKSPAGDVLSIVMSLGNDNKTTITAILNKKK